MGIPEMTPQQFVKARRLLGMSQTDLINVTGKSRSTISRAETGQGSIDPLWRFTFAALGHRKLRPGSHEFEQLQKLVRV
jgi:predicted transcriptional regulator